MNLKYLVSCMLLVGLSLVACSKKDDPKPDDGGKVTPRGDQKAQDLANKSFDEVMQIKYSKADLVCELWAQRGNSLNLQLLPNDSLRIDLKKPQALPATTVLGAKIVDHEITVKVTLNSESILSSFENSDQLGHFVFAQFTPELQVGVSYTMTTAYDSGSNSSGEATLNRRVNERVKDISIDMAESIGAHGALPREPNYYAIRDYMHCYIDTEIRELYQNQFKIQSKK